ncbi:MAG: hypothetical protein ACE5RT_01530 [Nitrosopumilaceae archaeon]
MKKVLGQLDTGKSLDVFKLKISQIKRELSQLEQAKNPLPELINSTNLLRSNEILSKTNQKKTDLLNAYELYFRELEKTVKKIQTGLKTLKSTKKKTRKKRTKAKKKTRKKKVSRKNNHIRKRKSSKRKR